MLQYILFGCTTVSIISLYYFLPKSILISNLNKFYPEIMTYLPKKDKKTIAITIDDVPYLRHNKTKEMIDYLTENSIKVTFFIIADDKLMTQDPEAIRMKKLLIDAVKNGHQLANHGITDSYHVLKDNNTLENEIDKCDDYISEIYLEANIPKPNIKYYRPGCGYFSRRMINMIENKGYKMALGSVFPHDPFSRNSHINFKYLTSKMEAGDIVILHDRAWTIDLLKLYIPWLRENNYEVELI